MQTITDHGEVGVFLKKLSHSFADLSNWAQWYAFEFTAPAPLAWADQARVTSLIKTIFPKNEGTVLWMKGSILCIVQLKGDFDLERTAQTIYELSDTAGLTLRVINIQQEHEKLLALIDRAGDASVEKYDADISYAALQKWVPSIDVLLRQWHSAKQQRKDRAKPLIMIVDDDRMVLVLVSHALKQKYDVITASSGREAIEKHLEQAPDIVLLDLGLPDCNGMTALHYMQQYDKDSRIVIFTADSYLRTQVNALSGGADGFLSKPFTREAFERYIAQWEPEEELAGLANKRA